MYYTRSGSYKKTKMIIDYTNIVLTIAATVIFIIIMVYNRAIFGLVPFKILNVLSWVLTLRVRVPIIIVKVVNSVRILLVPVSIAVKVVNSVLTLRVLA